MVSEDIAVEINAIITEILENEEAVVKPYQVKELVKIMQSNFKGFKKAFLKLADKILTLDARD